MILSTFERYALSVLAVALAAAAAFVVDHLIDAPNLSLVFVLPVIVAALSFGWGPALAAALLGVLTFDFLFVPPFFTLRVASPNDVWALGLLLVVAALASAVGAQSRRRALEGRKAADQAEALHTLAHAVIHGPGKGGLLQAGADALSAIFDAPAAVLTQIGAGVTPAALAGGARLSSADHEAAAWALAHDKPTRAETYPFDQAQFDFWPVRTSPETGLVLGVRLGGRADGRPAGPDRNVELVGGYLAAAARRTVNA